MKVKNIGGTSDNTCTCGSWLEHWKRNGGGTIPKWCQEKSCIKPPTVGAHVQKDSETDRSWYIVPLCDRHNKKQTELELMTGAVLVSANVKETCGKKR